MTLDAESFYALTDLVRLFVAWHETLERRSPDTAEWVPRAATPVFRLRAARQGA